MDDLLTGTIGVNEIDEINNSIKSIIVKLSKLRTELGQAMKSNTKVSVLNNKKVIGIKEEITDSQLILSHLTETRNSILDSRGSFIAGRLILNNNHYC